MPYTFLTGWVFKHAFQWLFHWFHPIDEHLQPHRNKNIIPALNYNKYKTGLRSDAHLVDWRVPCSLSLRGGVQAPQGGETAAAFTEVTRRSLVPLLDVAFCASWHLWRWKCKSMTVLIILFFKCFIYRPTFSYSLHLSFSSAAQYTHTEHVQPFLPVSDQRHNQRKAVLAFLG